ncbi:MAG TPA: branched-chain amino acid ABC transporter substrate-binding protein [Candidatus Dormibacteraeota bacterium]
MRLLLRSIAWIGVVSLISLAACSSGDSRPKAGIKIGVDLPLTGAEGQAGTPTLNGVRFFVHQHPVLDGFNVVVSARDDSLKGVQDPKVGAQNMSAFVIDPLVMGVIGPFNSSVARVTIPIANQAHLAVISPSTSNQCLTKVTFLPSGLSPTRQAVGCKEVGLPLPADLRPTKVNNFFRLATTDDLQGAAAADYGYTKLKLLRVAVLSDHEAYGQALASGFRSRFNKLGGLVVLYQDFTPAANLDLTTFFSRAKKDGAQAIYFGGVTANHGCLIRAQMAAVFGAAAPYLGGDGIAEDPACVRDAGTNAIGIHATVPAVDPDQAPGAKGAIDAFKAAYPGARDYGPYTMLAYDATAVLYDALDKAIKAGGGKLPARDEVVAKLAATTAFEGVTGTFGFDAAGDTTQRIVSVFQPTGSDPAAPWRWAGVVDYSSKLPY